MVKEKEVKEENKGITIVEHNEKLYFSDEYNNNNLQHPLFIPE
jgi:hypothetical protein